MNKDTLVEQQLKKFRETIHIKPDGSVPGEWTDSWNGASFEDKYICDECGSRLSDAKYFKTDGGMIVCERCERDILRPRRIGVREKKIEAFIRESIALAQQETIQGVKEFYSYLNHQIRMIESHPQDFSNDEFIGMQNVRERFEEVFDSELSSLKERKE